MGNFIAYELLPIILNMSLTASAVILFVLVMRLILRKAPRIPPTRCGWWCCSGCCVRSL